MDDGYTRKELDALKASLANKRLAVMAAVTNIQKAGWNDHHKYAYVSDPDVLAAVRSAMIQAGIASNVTMVSCESTPTGKSKPDGTAFVRSCPVMWMTLIDTDTGYSEDSEFKGECIEADDKGIGKAASYAVKYLLLKMFMIPTGLDTDESYTDPAPAPHVAHPVVEAKPPKDFKSAYEKERVKIGWPSWEEDHKSNVAFWTKIAATAINEESEIEPGDYENAWKLIKLIVAGKSKEPTLFASWRTTKTDKPDPGKGSQQHGGS